MDLLARREHSRSELENKLQQRVANSTVLAEVLDQLSEERLLSDERFCEAYAYYRKNRGFGPVRIKAELKARGVDEHLISDCLNEYEGDWLGVTVELIKKKYGDRLEMDIQSQARRQRFLSQRGFTFDQIKRAIAELARQE